MGKPTLENPDQTPPLSTHFSHPHPLQLSTATYGVSPPCAACKLDATGVIYSCTACPFVLHQKCYTLPQQVKHEFDKAHVLSLHPKPVYPEGLFRCDACGKQGDGFSYRCGPCGTDLHPLCATLPMLLAHHCHHHKLDLTFTAPYAGEAFSCDVCKRVGSKTWLYRCNVCEFDVHLSCLTMIPSVSSHQHQPVPQIQALPASRSLPHVGNQINHMGVFGQPRPQMMGNPMVVPVAQMNQYPVHMAQPPVMYQRLNNSQPIGTAIAGGIAEGIAGGITQAVMQEFLGVGEGGAAGGVLFSADGGNGGYGGTDAGFGGGGDVSYN